MLSTTTQKMAEIVQNPLEQFQIVPLIPIRSGAMDISFTNSSLMMVLATDRFKNSVMYKLCYYRMAELTNGMDYARNQRIGVPQFTLQNFDEAFTSENWIVRIYKVKNIQNRSPTISGISGVFPGFKSKR